VTRRETSGTGLGLAVVSEILELHGSRLEVESEVGIGSVFSFRLPLSSGLEIIELDLAALEGAGTAERDGS
jgi:signal transduction histidine kinase